MVRNFLDELRNINSGGDGTGGNPSNPGDNKTDPGNTVDPDNPTDPEVPPENPGDSLAASAQPGDYVRYQVPEKTFTMTTEQQGARVNKYIIQEIIQDYGRYCIMMKTWIANNK